MTLTQEEYVKRWEKLSTEKQGILRKVNDALSQAGANGQDVYVPEELTELLLELAAVSDGEYMTIYNQGYRDAVENL